MIPATISFTESAAFTALGNFIAAVTGLGAGQVIQGQQNRVAQPPLPDFVQMTALRQERLETNETTYYDNVVTGSIAGTTLTVSATSRLEGLGLQPGMLLIDGLWPVMNIAANTTIIEQLTGTEGGIGTYQVSVSQTLAPETLYAGLRADLVGTKWTFQLDIYGPKAGDNTKIIEALFRSEVGVELIGSAVSWDIVPLYCDEARQMPLVDGEEQYEQRFTMDACLQVSPVIGTPQQFATSVHVHTVEAGPIYTGP